MTSFTVKPSADFHLLRESECVEADWFATVRAHRIGSDGKPFVLLMQGCGNAACYVDLSAAQAKALAIELMASVDAIAAVMPGAAA